MRTFLLSQLLLVAFWMTGQFASAAEPRYALIIASANHSQDTKMVRQSLEKVAFKVSSPDRELSTKADIEEAVKNFADSLKEGDVALFYYAGDVFGEDGENYLLPTFSAKSEGDDQNGQPDEGEPAGESSSGDSQKVKTAAFPIQNVIQQLADKTKSGLNIVILNTLAQPAVCGNTDKSCEALPDKLTAVVGEQTVLVWSISQDNTGYSVFAKNLAKGMVTPKLNLADMIKVVKHHVQKETEQKTSLYGTETSRTDFYFSVPQTE